jgi:hypothetical protein
VWVLIAVATCGRGFLAAVQSRPSTLYLVYARAGQGWWNGTDLYALHDGHDVFRYSPLIGALLLPLAAMPAVVGEPCWRLLNVVVFLGGLAWWARTVLPRTMTPHERAGLILLAGILSASSLLDAQTNGIVIGLLMLTAAAATEDRWGLAAACLTVACLIKIYPVAFGLLFLVMYPRRFGPWFLAALTVGLGLPYLLQRPEYVTRQYLGWGHLLSLDEGRQQFPLDLCYRDLRLLCRVWLRPLSPLVFTLLQLGTAALLAGLCVAGQRAGWSQRLLIRRAFGLCCCWMLLLGPATEGVTYLFLVPSLSWAAIEVFREHRIWPVRLVVVGAVSCLLVAYTAVWFPQGKYLHQLGIHPFAALLLSAYLVDEAIRLPESKTAVSNADRCRELARAG